MQRGSLFSSSILALFALALLLTGCSGSVTIVHQLDEREANDIIVFLANKGIDAVKVRSATGGGGGGTDLVLWDIAVPPDQKISALAYLNAAGLPKRRGQSLLSIFSAGGLVPSEMEEKIRYQAGRAQEIANTIRKIDGVLDADVQLSFPETDPLNPTAPKENASASVYVKHTGVLDDPNRQLVPKIRRLVASAIEDLRPDDVTVIPDRAQFADVSLRESLRLRGEEKEYVSVWTVTIAKESVGRFRFIFFSLLLILFLLLSAAVWLIWKTYPLLREKLGMRDYFSLQRLQQPKEEKEEEEEKPAEKAEEEEEEEEGEPAVEEPETEEEERS